MIHEPDTNPVFKATRPKLSAVIEQTDSSCPVRMVASTNSDDPQKVAQNSTGITALALTLCFLQMS